MHNVFFWDAMNYGIRTIFWNDIKGNYSQGSPVGRGVLKKAEGKETLLFILCLPALSESFNVHTLLLFLKNGQQTFVPYNTNN